MSFSGNFYIYMSFISQVTVDNKLFSSSFSKGLYLYAITKVRDILCHDSSYRHITKGLWYIVSKKYITINENEGVQSMVMYSYNTVIGGLLRTNCSHWYWTIIYFSDQHLKYFTLLSVIIILYRSIYTHNTMWRY